jgi:hypothetical protein
MPKPDPNRPQLISLCRQFIIAANERHKPGSGLGSVGPVNWPDDKVLAQIKHMFTDHHGGIYFPAVFRAEAQQNEVALEALRKANVTLDEVRNALKKEGLKDLLTILGRVARLG